MAEEYWNRGRREGIQQSSALDTLERVLGIGSNIAGRVQSNRDRRRDFNTQWVNSLTSGWDTTYDSSRLNDMLSKMNDYKTRRVNEMDADTMEIFSLSESNIKNQIQKNLDYDTRLSSMGGITDKVEQWTIDQYEYGLMSPEAQAEKRGGVSKDAWESERRNNMRGYIDEYITAKNNWYAPHSKRISQTAPHLWSQASVTEEYVRQALKNWDDDGVINPQELNLTLTGMKTADLEGLRTYRANQAEDLDYVNKEFRTKFDEKVTLYESITDALRVGSFTDANDVVWDLNEDKDKAKDLRIAQAQLWKDVEGLNSQYIDRGRLNLAKQLGLKDPEGNVVGYDYGVKKKVKKKELPEVDKKVEDEKLTYKVGDKLVSKPITQEVKGRKKHIIFLRGKIENAKKNNFKTDKLEKQYDSEVKKLEKSGFRVDFFGRLAPILTPKEWEEEGEGKRASMDWRREEWYQNIPEKLSDIRPFRKKERAFQGKTRIRE
jgi:hypothetical protein